MVYKGYCDVIRTSTYSWKAFNPKELIVGKDYDVISQCNMQLVISKDENGNLYRDDSGRKYRYYKVENEYGHHIYVWDGCFEGDTL